MNIVSISSVITDDIFPFPLGRSHRTKAMVTLPWQEVLRTTDTAETKGIADIV